MTVSAADLRRLLKEAEAREADQAQETPHTRLLADLADEIVRPRDIGAALGRLFAWVESQGVDLFAEPTPADESTDPADDDEDQGVTPASETTGKDAEA